MDWWADGLSGGGWVIRWGDGLVGRWVVRGMGCQVGDVLSGGGCVVRWGGWVVNWRQFLAFCPPSLQPHLLPQHLLSPTPFWVELASASVLTQQSCAQLPGDLACVCMCVYGQVYSVYKNNI